MRKNILLFAFFMLLIVQQPFHVSASAASIGLSIRYDSGEDAYAVDMDTNIVRKYSIYSEHTDGRTWGPYEYSPPTGMTTNVHYLRCNLTYTLKFYDSTGSLLHEEITVTTQIVAPSCDSNTGEPPPTEEPPPGDGSGETTCNGCQTITEMLACPDWGTYMSEWEATIRRAVPPAPNWAEVAVTMRDTIVPPLVAAIESSATQISSQVESTGNQITNQVDATGKEIIQALGNAHYDGNSGLAVPDMVAYTQDQPTLDNKDIATPIEFNKDVGVPVFQVEDMTPTPEEMITIDDPLSWDSPALEQDLTRIQPSDHPGQPLQPGSCLYTTDNRTNNRTYFGT